MGGVTLLIACEADEASWSMAGAFLRGAKLAKAGDVEGTPTYRRGRVRLWCRGGGHLQEDNLDERYAHATGESVEEVWFLSKHVASSERPCLTVHPIGVPHLSSEEKPPFGGRSGRAPPPSPRMSAIWRSLLKVADDPRIPDFEVSLEVTHHGPWMTTPCAFLEIGSTDSTWGHPGAAEVWLDVLCELLGDEFEGVQPPVLNADLPVLITLGGGHYAPRANLMASEPHAILGHMLARHSLLFEQGPDGEVGGTWREAVDEVVRSTRAAHPGRRIVVSMDRKSFRGWERSPLLDHLDSLGVQVVNAEQHAAMILEAIG